MCGWGAKTEASADLNTAFADEKLSENSEKKQIGLNLSICSTIEPGNCPKIRHIQFDRKTSAFKIITEYTAG